MCLCICARKCIWCQFLVIQRVSGIDVSVTVSVTVSASVSVTVSAFLLGHIMQRILQESANQVD